MTEQNTYKFGNLSVTRTVIDTPYGKHTILDITRFNGAYDEILSPYDPDYKKAIILMLNERNQNENQSYI